MAQDGYIDGNPVAPCPGQMTNCPGVGIGFTRPWNKPWDVHLMRAANEPAKPPLKEDDIMDTIPFEAERADPA